jgi:hypothetical protein
LPQTEQGFSNTASDYEPLEQETCPASKASLRIHRASEPGANFEALLSTNRRPFLYPLVPGEEVELNAWSSGELQGNAQVRRSGNNRDPQRRLLLHRLPWIDLKRDCLGTREQETPCD